MSHLEALIGAPGPKKLLSIDGGGIRGLVAIEFLVKIEALLREAFERDDLVLADYFDYVAGTSTGAIISAFVAMGHPMGEIRDFYLEGANLMFEPANLFQRLARKSSGPFALLCGLIGVLAMNPAIFTPNALSKAIMEACGEDTMLGSERLRTLLMIVMRNASTDSPWWISNNPRAKYNIAMAAPQGATYSNLDIPLWKLIRASTAAPVFFPPEEIHIPGVARPFIFQDGGVSVHNNPAFQLFLMATLPEYRLGWPAGEENLLLVSIGTGLCESEDLNLKVHQMKLLYNVQALPAALMRSATNEQDLLCRIFGKLRPWCDLPPWDSEIGNLVGNDSPLKRKLFTYLRYNVELSERGLARLGLFDASKTPPGIDAKALQPLDGTQHVAELRAVGAAAAAGVTPEDFGGFLFSRGGEKLTSP
jgi:patatin-like phospholipase/acyl hydrolase